MAYCGTVERLAKVSIRDKSPVSQLLHRSITPLPFAPPVRYSVSVPVLLRSRCGILC